jgi:WD40 repeat protein
MHMQLTSSNRPGRTLNMPCVVCLQECQQHVGSVTQLLFTPDGSRMLSCGADGRVVVYAVHHGCLPVKALTMGPVATAGPQAGSSGSNGGGCGSSGSSSAHKAGRSASASSSSGGSCAAGVCAAVSPDGHFVAVGQPANGPGATPAAATAAAAAAGAGSSGAAAIILFNGALEAVLQIEPPATSISR